MRFPHLKNEAELTPSLKLKVDVFKALSYHVSIAYFMKLNGLKILRYVAVKRQNFKVNILKSKNKK